MGFGFNGGGAGVGAALGETLDTGTVTISSDITVRTGITDPDLLLDVFVIMAEPDMAQGGVEGFNSGVELRSPGPQFWGENWVVSSLAYNNTEGEWLLKLSNATVDGVIDVHYVIVEAIEEDISEPSITNVLYNEGGGEDNWTESISDSQYVTGSKNTDNLYAEIDTPGNEVGVQYHDWSNTVNFDDIDNLIVEFSIPTYHEGTYRNTLAGRVNAGSNTVWSVEQGLSRRTFYLSTRNQTGEQELSLRTYIDEITTNADYAARLEVEWYVVGYPDADS